MLPLPPQQHHAMINGGDKSVLATPSAAAGLGIHYIPYTKRYPGWENGSFENFHIFPSNYSSLTHVYVKTRKRLYVYHCCDSGSVKIQNYLPDPDPNG